MCLADEYAADLYMTHILATRVETPIVKGKDTIIS